MSEISDLKRRVEAVGEKFGRLAEQESRYGERLAGLLNAVEEGFARSQRETQTLKSELEGARTELENLSRDLEAAREDVRQHRSELAGVREEREALAGDLDRAKDENRQLRGMLLTLLEAVERGGNLDIGAAMRKLESRIDRIVTSTDGAPDIAAAAAAPVGETSTPDPREAETAQAESESPDDAAPTPAAQPAHEPLGLLDTVPDEAGFELEDVVAEVEAIAAEPVTPCDPEGPEDVEDLKEPDAPKEPDEPAQPKKAAAAARRTAEPPSDDDLSAVNKIIQRISLLTGEFVEPSHKRSDAAREKAVPSLKIGDGSQAADSPDDESTAKAS